MTRQEAIRFAADDVAQAAAYDAVGQVDLFGDLITVESITAAVASANERLASILAQTDADWTARDAATAAEEDRIESDAWEFAAGKA